MMDQMNGEPIKIEQQSKYTLTSQTQGAHNAGYLHVDPSTRPSPKDLSPISFFNWGPHSRESNMGLEGGRAFTPESTQGSGRSVSLTGTVELSGAKNAV